MLGPMSLRLLSDVAFVKGKVHKEKPKGQQRMVGRSHAKAALLTVRDGQNMKAFTTVKFIVLLLDLHF